MSLVHIQEISHNLEQAVKDCFDQFGGIDSFIKDNVFIKINATMPNISAITNPDVVIAVIRVLKTAKKKPKSIYVFDSTAVGFPTCLSFKVKNLDKRIKQEGAIPLFLDEQKEFEMIDFQGKGLNNPVPIPRILVDHLLQNKDKNTFINIPKLKTHLQTGITCCIKNLHGLLYDKEKIYNHHLVEDKVVELLTKFYPDFNIVDATSVTNHGMVAFQKDWLIQMNILIAGKDCVAVDTVGAKLLGIDSIYHLEKANEKNLGNSDFKKIKISPSLNILEKYKQQLNDQYENVPITLGEKTKIFSGNEKEGCRAGCKTILLYSYLFNQVAQNEGSVCIYGKGHDTKDFDNLLGPFIINGKCAVEELKDYFEQRADRKSIDVYYINEHFHMTECSNAVIKARKVPLKRMNSSLDVNIITMIACFIRAKIKGAIFESLF
ncbi:MAG: DUF362 domain-containing protein [Candidatus Thorarchaeota archaeon]